MKTIPHVHKTVTTTCRFFEKYLSGTWIWYFSFALCQYSASEQPRRFRCSRRCPSSSDLISLMLICNKQKTDKICKPVLLPMQHVCSPPSLQQHVAARPAHAWGTIKSKVHLILSMCNLPTFISSKTVSTPGLSSMTPLFFDEAASNAVRKYEMAEDMSGNCPPSDLRMTHLRRSVLSTDADENISGRRSAFSSPSRTLRKSLTCTGNALVSYNSIHINIYIFIYRAPYRTIEVGAECSNVGIVPCGWSTWCPHT